MTAAVDLATRREVRALLRQAKANLTGKKRGRDRGVRRNSIDEGERDAQREFGGKQTVPEFLALRDDILRMGEALCIRKETITALNEEGEEETLRVNANTILILKVIMAHWKAADRKVFPSYEALMDRTGLCKGTVGKHLKVIKAFGLLEIRRRSKKIRDKGEQGPQREQTSNLYFFDPAVLWEKLKRLPSELRNLWNDLLEKRRRKQRNAAAKRPAPDPARRPTTADGQMLLDAVSRLGERSFPGASLK